MSADKVFKIKAQLDVKDAAQSAKRLKDDLNKIPANRTLQDRLGGGDASGKDSSVPYVIRRELFNNLGFRGLASAAGGRALGAASAIPGGGALVELGITLLGVVGILSAFSKAVLGVASAARELGQQSNAVGLTTAQLEKLGFAGRATGTDSTALLNATARIRELQIKASTGEEGAQSQLRSIGISASGNPVDALLDVGKRFRSGSVGYFEAAQVLGTEVLPALSSGADLAAASFDRLNLATGQGAQQRLQSLGLILSNAFGLALARIRQIPERLDRIAEVAGFFITHPGPENPARQVTTAQVASNQAEFIQRQRAEDARKIREDNDREEYAQLQKKLPLQTQLNNLLAQRYTLQAQAALNGNSDPLTNQKIRTAVLSLNDQIEAAQQGLLRSPNASAPSADALQRIGLFRGGVPIETVKISQQQLEQLRVVARLLQGLPGEIATRL
jgi:hypothetical protein